MNNNNMKRTKGEKQKLLKENENMKTNEIKEEGEGKRKKKEEGRRKKKWRNNNNKKKKNN